MLTAIIPKLPMRDKNATIVYYSRLGFQLLNEYDDYVIFEMNQIEIHFFEFKALKPLENYGQIYIRANAIEHLYQDLIEADIDIHPNGKLDLKPWGQIEFSLLDPDNNLLTFGQSV